LSIHQGHAEHWFGMFSFVRAVSGRDGPAQGRGRWN